MTATSALSEPLLIAQWASRFNGYLPGAPTKTIKIADAYATLVTEVWVYVLSETACGHYDIPFELYIDRDGKTWVTTKRSPFVPIEERGHPIRPGGKAAQGVVLPRFDGAFRALWMRLVISNFRLPSTTLRDLNDEKARLLLRRHIPPLWEWKHALQADEKTPLKSADGLALDPSPLWLSVPSESPYFNGQPLRRVAVGTNPFHLARGRASVYLRDFRAYQREFEPQDAGPDSEAQRLLLARMIESTIAANQQTMDAMGKGVDWPRLRKALDDADVRRRQRVAAFERSGAALCQVLDSPLFRLFQEASMDEESEHGDDNLALKEHYSVVGYASQCLDRCTSGQALLRHWAEETEGRDDHVIVRAFWPTTLPSETQFKIYRWASKSIVTLLSQFVAHKVAVAKARTKMDFITKILKPLMLMATEVDPDTFAFITIGPFDPKKQIKGLVSPRTSSLVPISPGSPSLCASKPRPTSPGTSTWFSSTPFATPISSRTG